MKLVSLKLENFRSFERCELDLQREALIGVSGPNGAGKSTLLGAINYALFGRGRGSRELKPERDGMQAGDVCEVTLEFILDERSCVVVRGPKKAKLTVDGEVRVASGTEALTQHVTELLGVGQLTFGMTFYARQRELAALRENSERKTQLERLLGIDRIRNAHALARDQHGIQEKVVRALSEQLPSLAEAEAALRRAEEEAQRLAAPVKDARERRDEAQAVRERARAALTEARVLAEEAITLDGKAAVAASELSAARERERTTRGALEASREAAAEVHRLAPTAARAEELHARSHALDLEAQAAARIESLRDARHAAQREAVAVGEKLAEADDPAPRLEAAGHELVAARSELERITGELLRLGDERDSLRSACEATTHALQAARSAAALDRELTGLQGLRESAAARESRRAALGAEDGQHTAYIAEEREHYAHVKRDGPDATCPRCKAAYGDRFETIIEAFETTIAGLEARRRAIGSELEAIEREHASDAPKLERLGDAEAERRTLGAVRTDIGALEAEVAAAQQTWEEHVARGEELTAGRTRLTSSIHGLEEEVGTLRGQGAIRDALLGRRRDAQREVARIDDELEALPPNDYDAEAHETVRRDHAEAAAAETRCAELRGEAAQVELLDARLARDAEAAGAALATHEQLAAAAAARVADKTAPEQAEAAYDEAHSAYEEADEDLQDAEQRAIEESNAVAQARSELETAKRLKGRLDLEARELSIRGVVATVLDDFRAAVQQEAVPSLETETAELLRRTTRGRYSDVRITGEGALEISDMGAFHSITRFSGGEQDLANLCMRIALSKLLARRSCMDARFIILDEVFGSQDADRRRALLGALRELDQEFGQILIVSHFEDFLEHCALQVLVRSDDENKSVAELVTS